MGVVIETAVPAGDGDCQVGGFRAEGLRSAVIAATGLTLSSGVARTGRAGVGTPVIAGTGRWTRLRRSVGLRLAPLIRLAVGAIRHRRGIALSGLSGPRSPRSQVPAAVSSTLPLARRGGSRSLTWLRGRTSLAWVRVGGRWSLGWAAALFALGTLIVALTLTTGKAWRWAAGLPPSGRSRRAVGWQGRRHNLPSIWTAVLPAARVSCPFAGSSRHIPRFRRPAVQSGRTVVLVVRVATAQARPRLTGRPRLLAQSRRFAVQSRRSTVAVDWVAQTQAGPGLSLAIPPRLTGRLRLTIRPRIAIRSCLAVGRRGGGGERPARLSVS